MSCARADDELIERPGRASGRVRTLSTAWIPPRPATRSPIHPCSPPPRPWPPESKPWSQNPRVVIWMLIRLHRRVFGLVAFVCGPPRRRPQPLTSTLRRIRMPARIITWQPGTNRSARGRGHRRLRRRPPRPPGARCAIPSPMRSERGVAVGRRHLRPRPRPGRLARAPPRRSSSRSPTSSRFIADYRRRRHPRRAVHAGARRARARVVPRQRAARGA